MNQTIEHQAHVQAQVSLCPNQWAAVEGLEAVLRFKTQALSALYVFLNVCMYVLECILHSIMFASIGTYVNCIYGMYYCMAKTEAHSVK